MQGVIRQIEAFMQVERNCEPLSEPLSESQCCCFFEERITATSTQHQSVNKHINVHSVDPLLHNQQLIPLLHTHPLNPVCSSPHSRVLPIHLTAIFRLVGCTDAHAHHHLLHTFSTYTTPLCVPCLCSEHHNPSVR